MSPPRRRRLGLLLLLGCLVLAAAAYFQATYSPTNGQPAPPPAADGYLFCFWNVENLFDDRDDHRPGTADREYDRWFATDARALQLKLDHLSKALTDLNGGRGPDVLALAEVESERAADLLRQALNKRLADASLHYRHVLMKDVGGLRHISTAVLTRLPVDASRTQLHGRQQRILEGRVKVNGHELVVVAAHWTSRISDEKGDARGRYADAIYGRYRGMYRVNPDVDFLVCGDFNDEPDDPSVTKHLHAGGRDLLRQAGKEPVLLDLLAGKDPERFGTHLFRGRPYLFDHIAVSPGLLDGKGWACEPDSFQTVRSTTDPLDKKHARPWRFGNENDKFPRGYSDHFPVTVRLKVQEK
jgi:endonuclease/exonuclease/phosphatase family metal-dependent hydrolase